MNTWIKPEALLFVEIYSKHQKEWRVRGLKKYVTAHASFLDQNIPHFLSMISMILTSIYCVEKDIPMTYTNFTQPDPLVYIIVHNFDILNWRTGQNSPLKTNIGPSVLHAPAEQLRWPLFQVIILLVRAECVRCPWLLA